jgi:hypothetical protein
LARSKIDRAERNTRDHKRGKRIQPIVQPLERSFKWVVSDNAYPTTYFESMFDTQVEDRLSKMLEEQRVFLEYEYDNESSWPFSIWSPPKEV